MEVFFSWLISCVPHYMGEGLDVEVRGGVRCRVCDGRYPSVALEHPSSPQRVPHFTHRHFLTLYIFCVALISSLLSSRSARPDLSTAVLPGHLRGLQGSPPGVLHPYLPRHPSVHSEGRLCHLYMSPSHSKDLSGGRYSRVICFYSCVGLFMGCVMPKDEMLAI